MKTYNRIAAVFSPSVSKIVILVLLFASNSFFFLSNYINLPINYVYWTYPTDTLAQKTSVFLLHIAYLYVVSCVLVYVFGEKRQSSRAFRKMTR